MPSSGIPKCFMQALFIFSCLLRIHKRRRDKPQCGSTCRAASLWLSVLSLWTVIVSSGSAAARFPSAFFSFPATLFSSSFSFESYASLYRAQPPCLTTEFGATSDIRCGEDCGLPGAKSILGYGSSRLARMKKKKTTWVLNIVESSRSIKNIYFP